jgi:diaminopimelate epimerase
MEYIEFSKLNGQGNDFILVDATKRKVNLSGSQIIEMCDRNFGIGADGLIIIRPSKISDLKMDFYNRDGSISEMCGNGIRCMARFAYEKNIIVNKNIKIETLAGIKAISIDLKNSKAGRIRVNMGIPEFSPEKIPVNIKGMSEIFDYEIDVESKKFYINCVSMGNPHCVIFLDNSNEDLNDFPLNKWGPLLENLYIFPNKTNVEFVKTRSSNELDMRVWERGVGETLACGTGACAAGICGIKLNKVTGNEVIINLPGGKLNVFWDKSDLNVYLEGEVSYKFDGIYYFK